MGHRCYDYSHFAGEEAEAWSPCHTASKSSGPGNEAIACHATELCCLCSAEHYTLKLGQRGSCSTSHEIKDFSSGTKIPHLLVSHSTHAN